MMNSSRNTVRNMIYYLMQIFLCGILVVSVKMGSRHHKPNGHHSVDDGLNEKKRALGGVRWTAQVSADPVSGTFARRNEAGARGVRAAGVLHDIVDSIPTLFPHKVSRTSPPFTTGQGVVRAKSDATTPPLLVLPLAPEAPSLHMPSCAAAALAPTTVEG